MTSPAGNNTKKLGFTPSWNHPKTRGTEQNTIEGFPTESSGKVVTFKPKKKKTNYPKYKKLQEKEAGPSNNHENILNNSDRGRVFF